MVIKRVSSTLLKQLHVSEVELCEGNKRQKTLNKSPRPSVLLSSISSHVETNSSAAAGTSLITKRLPARLSTREELK